MPRNCGCQGAGTCACLLTSSDGSIQITGSGAAANPYDLSAGNIALSGRLQAQDTDSIDLTLNGTGTLADPFVLSAESALTLGELTDVDTTDTSVGYVVARQSDGSFAMDPPSTAPVGEINTDATIDGDGSAGAPLSVHDWDNFARLEGTDRSPDNLQSLILGSLTDETFTGFGVERMAPADYPNTDANAQFRIYNGGTGVGQQASIELFRDGIESTSFRIGPGDNLAVSVSSGASLPVPTRFFSTIVTVTATGGTSATGAVSFPAGRFVNPPALVGARTRGEAGQPSNGMIVDFFNVSATGASLSARTQDNQNMIGQHEISVIASEVMEEPA